jgi:extracellular elastinolytic metalloproteinase
MKKTLIQLVILGTFLFNASAQVSQTQITSELAQVLKNEQFPGAEKLEFAITSQYTSAHNGITHVYGNQLVFGLEVFNANVDIHLNQAGKVVAYHHNFIPTAEARINSKTAKLSPMQSLQSAAASEGISAASIANKTSEWNNGKMVWFDPTISSEKIAVKQGYFAKADKLMLVYQVEILNDETNDWWNKKVDAQTGEIIEQVSYTTHCELPVHPSNSAKQLNDFRFDEEVSAISLGKKANNGTYNVFPLPLESPARGPRSLVTNPAAANSSPFGWHDTDGVAGAEFTITRGNNVWAKEDKANDNETTIGFSPDGGDSLTFDYPYGVDSSAAKNLNAAIVNLFFWNNLLHDVFFNYGFDEVSGNFQQKNFSGKGIGKDAVLADAQDGSGTSNANFSSPVDGSSGRMQMFLWPTSGASNANNTLGIIYPSDVAGVYFGPQSVAGPRLTAEGLKGKIVLLKDSNATTSFGCGLIANTSEMAGNIVLIDRGGSCGTQSASNRTKIKAAQNAGAIAVIIAHNINGFTPTAVNGADATITIPSISISFSTGVFIKNALATDSVIVTLFDSSQFNTARVYDSDLDNGVMAHEFGHGISTRLTGGPANSSCLGNQEQAGEGWSDFFALALTTRTWETSASTSRGIGTFLIDQDTNGLGIRNYKYSRNMTINPVTYNSIKTLAVPHGVGSVWCSMLYDIYWDMIDKYGFDADWYNGKGGNNKTMQLVMDGLKLQPCIPGFIDARNAIIKADSINNGGANKDLLWKAFARRGLGFLAIQGSSASRTDGTENYSLPPVVGLNSITENENFRMYPNPAKTEITIDVFNGASVVGIEIFDLSGKLVQHNSALNTKLPSANFALNQHQSGYYLIKIISSEGIAYKKLLIN